MSAIARQSVSNAFASGFILLGGTLGSIVVARLLGPEALGVVSYATWLVGLVLVVADLGMPGALARYLPELRATGDGDQADALTAVVARIYFASLGVAALCLTGLGLWLVLGEGRAPTSIAVGGYLASPLFWFAVAAAVVGQGALNFAVGLLRGRQDFARMARLTLAAAAVQVAATALGAQLLGLAGALSGAVLVGLAPLAFLAASLAPAGRMDRTVRRRVVRYCSATWALYLLAAVTSTRTEIFFLERSWGSGAVAHFSVSLTLANLAVQGPMLLIGTLLPHLSQLLASGRRAEAAMTYAGAMRLLAMIVFPAAFGLAAIAPALIPLAFGPGFAEAALPAAILIAASALAALTAVAQVFMNAAERNAFSVAVGLAGALAIVASGFVIIPAYGIVAAAGMRASVQLCTAILSLWYVRSRLAAPAPLASLFRFACASAACGAAALAITRAVAGWSGILLAVLAGVLTYLGCLRLFRCVRASDLAWIRGRIPALPFPFAGMATGITRFYGGPSSR